MSMSSLKLFSLSGQNVLITGATRGMYYTPYLTNEHVWNPLFLPNYGSLNGRLTLNPF
jgi:hypothetical protein